jgi:hypothetical protein
MWRTPTLSLSLAYRQAGIQSEISGLIQKFPNDVSQEFLDKEFTL